jgi:hypothetical protein
MLIDDYLDAMDLREQMTRPARESAAQTTRETVRDFERKIAFAETRRRLPMFEANKESELARLERLKQLTAHVLAVTELSLLGPG